MDLILSGQITYVYIHSSKSNFFLTWPTLYGKVPTFMTLSIIISLLKCRFMIYQFRTCIFYSFELVETILGQYEEARESLAVFEAGKGHNLS
jgi:hypothetical protein